MAMGDRPVSISTPPHLTRTRPCARLTLEAARQGPAWRCDDCAELTASGKKRKTERAQVAAGRSVSGEEQRDSSDEEPEEPQNAPPPPPPSRAGASAQNAKGVS